MNYRSFLDKSPSEKKRLKEEYINIKETRFDIKLW